jgi:hypothetical protein
MNAGSDVWFNVLKGPNKVEVLLLLLPIFLIFPVIFIVLVAVSLQAKRREAEESKALSPEGREE